MNDAPPPILPRELLTRYPTRETKIGRIREIEKLLEKMEMEDEHNDPRIIQGHIRLTRSYRAGCGVFLLCLAAMSLRAFLAAKRGWIEALAIALAVVGFVMILRGLLYRPDPIAIQAAYSPHRGTPHYRAIVSELDQLARALSQDLQAEDQG